MSFAVHRYYLFIEKFDATLFMFRWITLNGSQISSPETLTTEYTKSDQ